MIYYVITFANTHSAITTQSHLESVANVSIMPTLREISAGCGISIRFESEELDHVMAGLKNHGLDEQMYKIYKISQENDKIIPSLLK